MIIGTEKNFEQEVLQYDGTTLVYFWAVWCGPCKVMSPTIEEFAKKSNGVKVIKINADENQELAQKYSIMSIPTVLIFKSGNVINQVVGAQSIDQLQAITA